MKRLLLLYLLALTIASLMPVSELPESPLPPGIDKCIHLFMYAILCCVALLAFACKGDRIAWILGIVTACILYGILLEYLQPLLSTRSFEWADIAANTFGVLSAVLFWPLARKFNNKKQGHPNEIHPA